VKAMFIGRDKSRGFEKNKIYSIRTEVNMVNGKPALCVHVNNSELWCPYANLEAMLDNWQIIREIKTE
jgi:hypothetical protein